MIQKRITWLCLAITVLTACSTQRIPPSGFLGDQELYQQMQYNSKYGVYEYIPDRSALRPYRAFIVPDVAVYMPNKADNRDLDKVAAEMRRKIIRALGDKYMVLPQPGADVATLRIALTNAKPTLGMLGVGGIQYASMQSGAVAMEAEVLDSVTGKLLMAVMDTRGGEGASLLAPATRWGTAYGAFDGWANNLQRRLQDMDSAVVGARQ